MNFTVFLILSTILSVLGGNDKHRAEFTFLLNDRDTVCFTELFHPNDTRNFTLHYHSLRGETPMRATITDPRSVLLYDETQTNGNTTFLTSKGTFKMCFTNPNFVSLHQLAVYMRLEETGYVRQESLTGYPGALGARESQCETIATHLSSMRDHQRDYRLRAESGRVFADILHDRLSWWAGLCTLALLIVGGGQTICLKRLFTPTTSMERPEGKTNGQAKITKPYAHSEWNDNGWIG